LADEDLNEIVNDSEKVVAYLIEINKPYLTVEVNDGIIELNRGIIDLPLPSPEASILIRSVTPKSEDTE